MCCCPSVFFRFFLLSRRAATKYSLGPVLRRFLISVPIAYVVFDLLENASVLALLTKYPERMDVLAATLPYTTIVKRAASLLALGVPLAMLGFELVRRRMCARAK